MTQAELDRANDLSAQITKFKVCKVNNFQIQIENWANGNIVDSDLRPDTQAKIKQLLIDELDYLTSEFQGM